ncbi:hypothetical protein ABPG73_011619 [Tetrahymena malaccensis]
MSLIYKLTTFLIFIKYSFSSSISIVNSNFSQTGIFVISSNNTPISVNFNSAFSSIPQVIISQTFMDTSNTTTELDFQIQITNVGCNGFQAALIFSQNSQVFEVKYTYIATIGQNIYSNSKSISISDMIQSSDSKYQIYQTIIPLSQSSLLNNSKIQAKVIGFMTGFYISYYGQNLDIYFQIIQNQNNIQIQVRQDLTNQAQLNTIRFNYFEFYYQENNSIMMDMYQETSYEFITDPSNCLYNNLVGSDYNNLNAQCKAGLSGQDLSPKYARVQTSTTPINFYHNNKSDFAIGFSKISCNSNAQNPRIVLYDYFFNSIGMYITYYTWQGTQVLGITSTIIELYGLQCPDKYFYSFAVSDCVQSCESQTYQELYSSNNNLLPTCNNCDTTCFDCTGPLSNNCKSCSTSFPYYNTITNECLQQQPNSGSLATDCTACSQSYPYYNTLSNICMSQKPSPGFICQQSQSSNPPYQQNCYSCNDPNCLVCIDVSPNSCIQCQANTYLYNKSCSLTKPSPAYCDSQNNCLACTIQFCLSCDQGPETCSLCPPSFYIDQNSYQCKCPYASYLDVNNNNYQCLSCPSNCAICLNSTTCQQCASNSLPDPQNPGNCILNCQQGQFYNKQSQSCQQCAANCLTCFGSKNNCLSCKSGAQTVLNSANNNQECICIDQKDTLNNLTGICQKCPDPLCQQCDPNNRSLCQQCITQASFSQTDQKCECSQSTYYISSTNSCISCPQSNCLQCLSDGSQCVKCKSGFYYDSNFQTCSFCKQDIPFSKVDQLNNTITKAKVIGFMTGFQIDQLNKILDLEFKIYNNQTHINIEVKQKKDIPAQLMNIKFNYFEFYYQDNNSNMMDIYQETSYDIISDTTNCLFNNLVDSNYDNNINKTCQIGLNYSQKKTYRARVQSSNSEIKVKHNTKSNFALGTKVLGVTSTIVEFYSQKCPDNYFYSFASQDCVSSCESQTYKGQLNYLLPTCYKCNVACLECKGPLSTDCTKCSNSYPCYNNNTSECLAYQPNSGYFFDQSSNCFPCKDANCLTCKDLNTNSCIQCQPNTYLFNKNCSQKKPSPAYCDNNNVCFACTIQFCLNCDKGYQTCSQCPPSFQVDKTSQRCICPERYFLNPNNTQCEECPSNCSICLNSNTCQQCSSNSITDPLNTEKCIQNCQQGSFYNRQTLSCQLCAPTCNTCSESQQNCKSCKDGAILVFNSFLNQHDCKCQDSEDIINEFTGICQKCQDNKCQKCDISNRSICLQCIKQAEYSNIDKKCECSQSTYYSPSKNVCIQCPQANCLKCSPDGSQCIQCKNGYFFDSRHNTCSFCSSGKYTNNENNCNQKCIDQCEFCSDSSSCFSYYLNATLAESQCYFKCSKCKASNINQCLECSSSTRVLDQQTNSCVCQSSFIETNKQDCQFSPSPNILFKITNVMTSIQYFVYLPTLIINHHPFSDYFLINSQLIGDQFYSQQLDQLN